MRSQPPAYSAAVSSRPLRFLPSLRNGYPESRGYPPSRSPRALPSGLTACTAAGAREAPAGTAVEQEGAKSKLFTILGAATEPLTSGASRLALSHGTLLPGPSQLHTWEAAARAVLACRSRGASFAFLLRQLSSG